jgi:hypothetical protein
LHHFAEALPSNGPFQLSHVTLNIPDSQTAVFRAQLHGPTGSQVWARAWLSNESDGTLAETESPPQVAGTDVEMLPTFLLLRSQASLRLALGFELVKKIFTKSPNDHFTNHKPMANYYATPGQVSACRQPPRGGIAQFEFFRLHGLLKTTIS